MTVQNRRRSAVNLRSKVAAATGSSLGLVGFTLFALSSSKFRSTLKERYSFGAWSEIKPEPTLWIHAASLGELQGVKPLLPQLRSEYDLRIVVTTTSVPGRTNAQGLAQVDTALLLPLDHPVFMRRAIKRIQPVLFLGFETELWPNLLSCLAESDVPAVIINGRISDRSFARYRLVAPLISPFVSTLTLCLTQTEQDSVRFNSLGVKKERLKVTGSTKYELSEENLDAQARELRSELCIDLQRQLFVCGSVRPGESEIILSAFKNLQSEFPKLHLLLAPRHPERFEAEAKIIESFALPLSRRGSLNRKESSVFLLDSIGELRTAYAAAEIVFVGGTLVPVGGHNLIEAALLRRVLIFGPFTANVSDVAADLLQNRGAIMVTDTEELQDALRLLLSDQGLREGMAAAAYGVAKKYSGAASRVMSELSRVFPG